MNETESSQPSPSEPQPSQTEGTKPCHNCPNKVSQLTKVVLVVYTGGPPHAQYVALAQAIPPRDETVLLQYGWPMARADGCLEYRGGQVPPVPEGYEADKDDPYVLKPVWPSCSHRMLRVQMNNDSGLLRVEGVCMDPRSGKKGHETLTVAHCQQCSVRRSILLLDVKLRVTHPGLVRLAGHQLKDPALGKVHQLATNDVNAKLP